MPHVESWPLRDASSHALRGPAPLAEANSRSRGERTDGHRHTPSAVGRRARIGVARGTKLAQLKRHNERVDTAGHQQTLTMWDPQQRRAAGPAIPGPVHGRSGARSRAPPQPSPVREPCDQVRFRALRPPRAVLCSASRCRGAGPVPWRSWYATSRGDRTGDSGSGAPLLSPLQALAIGCTEAHHRARRGRATSTRPTHLD